MQTSDLPARRNAAQIILLGSQDQSIHIDMCRREDGYTNHNTTINLKCRQSTRHEVRGARAYTINVDIKNRDTLLFLCLPVYCNCRHNYLRYYLSPPVNWVCILFVQTFSCHVLQSSHPWITMIIVIIIANKIFWSSLLLLLLWWTTFILVVVT